MTGSGTGRNPIFFMVMTGGWFVAFCLINILHDTHDTNANLLLFIYIYIFEILIIIGGWFMALCYLHKQPILHDTNLLLFTLWLFNVAMV